MKRPVLLTLLVMAMLAVVGQAWAGDGGMVVHRLLLDVRSTHSDGEFDMDTLAKMSEARDIDVLAITDHDRKGIRLGLAPLPNILGWTIDKRSLYTTGLAPFFADLARARARYPQMILLAGTESAPGYAWSGVPFINLTLHNAERALLTIGEERPAQITALPSFDLSHVQGSVTLGLIFWATLAAAALLWLLRRRRRGLALAVALSAAGFALTWWMRTSPDADAACIRAARQQGLLVIWAHPGTHSGVRQGPMGVRLDTPPYPEVVFRPPLADAFAGIYGDSDHLSEPGGRWDAELTAYLLGAQPRPVWVVSAGDFHAQGEANEYLGNFPMDVWTAAGTPAAVLEAMHRGRMVAWGLPRDRNLRFVSLSCQDASGRKLLPGDEASVGSDVSVQGLVAERPAAKLGSRMTWPVQIIVDGRVAATPVLTVGQPFSWPLSLAPGGHAVRLRLWQGAVRMLSNPFLLRVRG
jgi:hypothetical protein